MYVKNVHKNGDETGPNDMFGSTPGPMLTEKNWGEGTANGQLFLIHY